MDSITSHGAVTPSRDQTSLPLVGNPSTVGQGRSESLPCGRRLEGCGHLCQEPRHEKSDCGPCHQLCNACCLHRQCTMPCAAPCNSVPCPRRCMRLLDCGHQCPSVCGEACPEVKFCQTCCPEEDILLTPLISKSVMKDYRDLNLDEDPCIFPPCGHFQTRSFMDDHFRTGEFYNLDDDKLPSTIKGTLNPFSIQELPCCTRCRGSLREICRYGRIIRGPILDRSLKEFLDWRNGRFSELIDRLAQSVPALNWCMAYRGLPSTTLPHQNAIPVQLSGNMLHQLHVLNDLVGQGRYADMVILFLHIQDFSFGELRYRENIFQKVSDFKRRENGGGNSGTSFTEINRQHKPLFQLTGNLYAMDLLLRCNIVVLDDFLRLRRRSPASSTSAVSRPPVLLDLSSNFRGTQLFITQARAANAHMITAHGHVYFAWYCSFALALGADTSTHRRRHGQAVVGGPGIPVSQDELTRCAKKHLAKADALYKASLQASRCLKEAIEGTRDFLRSSNQGSLRVPRTLWYTNVTGRSGRTGPWHVCGNGHAFMDVRQRSMFLKQLRCKDCGMIVEGRQSASKEEAPVGTAAAGPSEEAILVDI